jgi:hypothetical protein
MGRVDNVSGVWVPDFPGDIVSVDNMDTPPKPEAPITVCAHCRKPLTAFEVKATFEGMLTVWDSREKRSGVTLDYCADGLREVEEAIQTSIRDALERDEKIRAMDAEDKLKIGGRPT